jgi:hypothetical protein
MKLLPMLTNKGSDAPTGGGGRDHRLSAINQHQVKAIQPVVNWPDETLADATHHARPFASLAEVNEEAAI